MRPRKRSWRMLAGRCSSNRNPIADAFQPSHSALSADCRLKCPDKLFRGAAPSPASDMIFTGNSKHRKCFEAAGPKTKYGRRSKPRRQSLLRTAKPMQPGSIPLSPVLRGRGARGRDLAKTDRFVRPIGLSEIAIAHPAPSLPTPLPRSTGERGA
jgi:hypothetical protein